MFTTYPAETQHAGTSTNPASAYYPPSSTTDICRKIGTMIVVWCAKCGRWNNSNDSNTNCNRPHPVELHNSFMNGQPFGNMPHKSSIQQAVNAARRNDVDQKIVNSNVVHAQRSDHYTKKKHKKNSSRRIILFSTYPKSITSKGKTKSDGTSRRSTNNSRTKNNCPTNNKKAGKEEEEEEEEIMMEEDEEEEGEDEITLSNNVGMEEEDDDSSTDEVMSDRNDDDDEATTSDDDDEEEDEDTASVEVVHPPISISLKDVTNNTSCAVNEKKRNRGDPSTGNTRTSSTHTHDTHTRPKRQRKPTDFAYRGIDIPDSHAALHAKVVKSD